MQSLSSPSSCSVPCRPTLCSYLETFPTVYCDKLNTKLWGGRPALAASHIVVLLLHLACQPSQHCIGELTSVAVSLILYKFQQ